MKTKGIVILVVIILGILAVLLAPAMMRFVKNSRNYGQAEPLVKQVWPLAESMKAYRSNHDSNATSLVEIVRFTSNTEFLTLAKFNPEFMPNGTNIFSMRVNDMFGFTISADFNPEWVHSQRRN